MTKNEYLEFVDCNEYNHIDYSIVFDSTISELTHRINPTLNLSNVDDSKRDFVYFYDFEVLSIYGQNNILDFHKYAMRHNISESGGVHFITEKGLPVFIMPIEK